MFAVTETIDGHILWARRRGWPGPGGLNWHMAAHSCIETVRGDVGLLTGTQEEMQALANRLIRMRDARGMTSTVTVVEVQQ
jgi:outer membrane receptor for ferric coprogen and ferric-rhodotorulic acid